jgi:hypothetical protein
MGAPDDYGKMSGYPFRSVVLRLKSDFTVEWRKAIPVRAGPLATKSRPRVMWDGDLIIPGMDSLFRIDPNGALKAQSKIEVCTWLRTINDDPRLRFACLEVSKGQGSTTIVEYD